MRDLRRHDVEMLTIGQYLQPRAGNLPVRRYAPPATFEALADLARTMGFAHVASGPLVRSSYHADRQALAAVHA
jgi:lipoic acid synthetase